MDKIKAICLTKFFNNSSVIFEEKQAVIFKQTITYTGVKEDDALLERLADRLACITTLGECLITPKKCLIPFYKELWTRYLKTLVNNSDESRWSSKLFADRPMLQWPYFLFESGINLLDGTEEELKEVLSTSLEIMKYCSDSCSKDIADLFKKS
jgi:hypothetical protein